MSIRSPNKRKRLHVCPWRPRYREIGFSDVVLHEPFAFLLPSASFPETAKTVAMDYAAKRVEFDVDDEDDGRTEKLSLEICITDFSGNDCYKDARYATYDDSGLDIDAFLVVVSKNETESESLHLVQSKWFEEIAHCYKLEGSTNSARSSTMCLSVLPQRR